VIGEFVPITRAPVWVPDMVEDVVEWCEVIAIDEFDGITQSPGRLHVCIEGPVRGRRWVSLEYLDAQGL